MTIPSTPLISIVLPTYNGERFLKEAIQSCLDQTYRNIELIIVDDCSTDRTAVIAQSFNDPRIRYHRNPRNQRLPESLNIGFHQSKGDYLTWTSDDNRYMPHAIESMYGYLEGSDHNFVYADYFKVDESEIGNPIIKNAQLTRCTYPTQLNVTNHIGACFLYSRKVFQSIGDYNPELELVEDYDYWIRVSKKFTMGHIDEPLYYYCRHDQSLYTTRFFEVKLVDELVKLRNELVDIKDTTYAIKQLKLFILKMRYSNTPFSSETLKRYGQVQRYHFFLRIYAKLWTNYQIFRLLNKMRRQEFSFTETKSRLMSLLNIH